MYDTVEDYTREIDRFDAPDYTENNSLNDNFFGQGYFDDDPLEYTHAF